MNHDSWSTDEPRSARITGSALVITRLSRVAMNIGSEAATTASQTGTRRAVGAAAVAGDCSGVRCVGPDVEGGGHPGSPIKKALNDYFCSRR